MLLGFNLCVKTNLIVFQALTSRQCRPVPRGLFPVAPSSQATAVTGRPCCPPKAAPSEHLRPVCLWSQQPPAPHTHTQKGALTCWGTCVGRIPIVPVVCWREAHPRLGLRVGGCRHITLLTHYENVIPRGTSTKEPCNRRKKSTRGGESPNAIKNVSPVHKCF